MLKLIIVNSDIKYIQKIIETISENELNVGIYSFFIEANEQLYNLLKNKKIDIIVMRANSDGKNILNWLIKNKCVEFLKSIIITYENKNELENIKIKEMVKYIFKIIENTRNFELLIKTIDELNSIKNKNYENNSLDFRIEKNLNNLGYSLKHKGTQYLVEIINYLYKNNLDNFVLNEMYEKLSKKHKKSINTIKGNIMQATKSMYNCYNKDFIINYFDYIELIKLPTVKEIILTVAEKIQNKKS